MSGSQRPEPIYAEPTKCPRVMTPVMLRAKSNRIAAALSDEDDDGLTAVETSTPNRHTLATSGGAGNPLQRTFLGNNNNGTATAAVGIDTNSSLSSIQSRRHHSKSLSLSEGKTLAKAFETPSLRLCTFSGSSQLFQQNRSMWEKRAEPAEAVGAGGDRNSRNAAPDLVLDLPAAKSASSSSSSLIGDGGTANAAAGATADLGKEGALEGAPPSSPDPVEETGADCFAHNQYTLKKNDKFLPQSVLHISEEEEQAATAAATAASQSRGEGNTHKFIAQFADLKLTGGSLPVIKGTAAAACAASGEGTGVEIPIRPILRREKPQILKKPVLMMTGPSSTSGPPSLMSFNNGRGGGSGEGEVDQATGAKSLE